MQGYKDVKEGREKNLEEPFIEPKSRMEDDKTK